MRLAAALLGILFLLTAQAAPSFAAAELPEPVVANAKAALDAADKRDFDKANRLAALSGLPLIQKIVHWTELTRPEPGGDFARSAAFIEANLHWPWQWNLRRRAERAIDASADAGRVAAWLEANPPLTNAGWEALADAYLRLGREAEGWDALRRGWLEGVFNTSDERRMLQRLKGKVSREQELERLENLLWAGHAISARRQAARLGGKYPHYAEARIALQRMSGNVDSRIAQVPAEMQQMPGFVYDRARWRLRKGRYEGVMALIDPPDPTLPRAERWWGLRHWAVREAIEKGDLTAARRLAANHGLTSGLGFAQGEWLAGWISLRALNEPEPALAHFERMYAGVSTPVSRARAAYWAGRAAEALNQKVTAERWYDLAAAHSTTFYGQLAADKATGRFNVALDGLRAPSPARVTLFRRQELVQVILLLSRLDEQERLEPFFHALRTRAESEEEFQLVADLADTIRRDDLAVRTARDARREGIILSDHLYPLPRDIAQRVSPDPADTSAPDPALLLAIIRQESGFDIGAISSAGARGLMQLMPATARAVASKVNVGYDRGRLLKDPDYNLHLGSAYMRRLLDRYDGSMLLAVAAYNAGPGNVSKWIAAYGDPRSDWVDPIDWIELIPLSETRNYVQRIFESVPIYRQRMLPAQIALMVSPELRHPGSAADRDGTNPVFP